MGTGERALIRLPVTSTEQRMTAREIRDTASPAGNPPAAERRAHARYAVDTSANIIFVRTGSRLSGRIVDLSIGGCRIFCDQRFPVGIFARIEAEFRVEGITFRLGGVLQRISDRRIVGIRFLDMSHRKREQLAQLIEGIKAAQGQ